MINSGVLFFLFLFKHNSHSLCSSQIHLLKVTWRDSIRLVFSWEDTNTFFHVLCIQVPTKVSVGW